MNGDPGNITTHFISHWGVPKAIRPIKAKGISSLAILEFGPTGNRPTWYYATNGMSSYIQPQSISAIKVRTEVFAATSKMVEWIDDLLTALALYPLQNSTYIAEGDTIEVGQPIDRKNSFYTGVLFAPPCVDNSSTLGLVGGASDDILVHQVIGLFPSELNYAKRFTGMELWARLEKLGKMNLDLSREKVA